MSSLALGVVVVLASGYKALTDDRERWEDWIDVVAGMAAVLLPIVFGFGVTTLAFWTILVLGVGVLGLSGYQIYEAQLAPTR